MPSTRLQLEQDVVRALAPRDESLVPVSIPSTTTALGAVSNLRDLALGRGTANADLYNGRFIKIAELVGGGPAVGEIAIATDGGFTAPDTLAFSPNLTAAVQSGTDYLLYPRGLSPAIVVERINQVLRETYVPHIWFPSLVPDSDFSSQSLANWPVVAGGGRTFVTTAGTQLFGESVLRITGVAAGDGARSSFWPVTVGETFVIVVFCRVAAGSTLRVALTNEAGTVLSNATADVTDEEMMEVRFFVSVPTMTAPARVQLRFTQVGATALEAYVSAPIVAQAASGRPYDNPTWLEYPAQLQSAYRYRAGLGLTAANFVWVALANRPRSTSLPAVLQAARDTVPIHVVVDRLPSTDPVYFVARRPFGELTTDGGSTAADRRYVVAAVLANLLRDRSDPMYTIWQRRAKVRARALHLGGVDVLVEQPMITLYPEVAAPPPRVV